jgi:HAMP domain-containing protein
MPEKHGDRVERATLLKAEATGGEAAGKELGQTAFALRVVRPWKVGDRLIGYVELGEEIDGFLHRMKAQTGDDYLLLAEKRRLDPVSFAAVRARDGMRNDWDDRAELVAIDATEPGVAPSGWTGSLAALPAHGTFLGAGKEGSLAFARGVLPVTDAIGERVGALVVRSDVTAMHDNMTRARVRVIALVISLSLLSAAAIVYFVNRLVFARLHRMTEQLEDVAARLVGGDYDVANAIQPPAARDEIGSFEAFFGRFIAVVGGLLKELTQRRAG